MRRPILKHHLTLPQYFKNAAVGGQAHGGAGAPFVTISREAGAGGHALAEALAARLAREETDALSGWQIFDKSICERVAADPELHVSLESLINEEFHTGLDDYLRGVLANQSSQIKVDHRMFRTVRGICALGKAIVIGRAAVLLTRDLPLGVHVRLVSHPKARLERFALQEGLSLAAARESIDLQDERRARLAANYFRRDIADPLLYDCIWNTDNVTCDAISESLIKLIRRRLAKVARAGLPEEAQAAVKPRR